MPHNEYLHVTVQLGVVGLLMFLSIKYKLLKILFKIHKDQCCAPICRQLGLYVGAILVGLLFNSLYSDTISQDYFWMCTYFLSGITVGACAHAETHRFKFASKDGKP